MSSTIGECITDMLAADKVAANWTGDDIAWVRKQTELAATAAFDDDDRASRETLNRAAFDIFVARHRVPWSSALPDTGNPGIAAFLWVYGREWDRVDTERHRSTLAQIPEPAAYSDWIVQVVQNHESNVGHPLFEFLAQEATFDQLREFIFQETPFDLYFADILSSLLPGIYGEPKMEIAENLWDEMGGGQLAKTHRTLRLDLMKHLKLPHDAHESDPAQFVLEEIELANAYFLGATDRGRALQLIGMLMATESMVPGRLERQIEGWRRVGLEDEKMVYLLEHTVVDVEHAEDWMEHVVRPIVHERPEAMREITLGALRRLEIAGRICDRMMSHLQRARAAEVPA